MCGHTAPVSSLRLDPTGVFCLSYDADGRDRSIRLWNLNKGELSDRALKINSFYFAKCWDSKIFNNYCLLSVSAKSVE